MKYTITQFNKDFPDDEVCLDTIFKNRYGDLTTCPDCGVSDTKFYRVKKRKCYECMRCGFQLNPLTDTIFHKSKTPLTKWFYAIYLFSVSKNGVSSKELERHLGVTYKTAWRMAKQIRLLLQQDGDKLSGIVEADETYIGGKHKTSERFSSKTAVLGLVERKGQVKAIVSKAKAKDALAFMAASLEAEAEVHTDETKIYNRVSRPYTHQVINHSEKEFARGNVTTNTIEGFWSQLKRSLDGTHYSVSPKHLQSYVNEFAYRYNHRSQTIFHLMLATAAKQV